MTTNEKNRSTSTRPELEHRPTMNEAATTVPGWYRTSDGRRMLLAVSGEPPAWRIYEDGSRLVWEGSASELADYTEDTILWNEEAWKGGDEANEGRVQELRAELEVLVGVDDTPRGTAIMEELASLGDPGAPEWLASRALADPVEERLVIVPEVSVSTEYLRDVQAAAEALAGLMPAIDEAFELIGKVLPMH